MENILKSMDENWYFIENPWTKWMRTGGILWNMSEENEDTPIAGWFLSNGTSY